jgi:hypothetical protein
MVSKINSSKPLNHYISSLIENLNKENISKNLDLILDSGVFHGGSQLGILLYLKELENLKLLNINRISGCSVGALLGTLYLSNKLDLAVNIYDKLLQSYRNNCTPQNLYSIITDTVNNIDDITIFNNKLYITYYDTINIESVTIFIYPTKNDLIEALIKSSYVPYIIDGNIQYKDCCDGFLPYIFPKSDKQILYIYLHPLNKIKNMFYVNNGNIWSRLLPGIVDVNNFFVGSKSEFCSYLDKCALKTICFFRIKELFVLFIILLLKCLSIINNNIPETIKDNPYILRLQTILFSLYKDIFSHLIL